MGCLKVALDREGVKAKGEMRAKMLELLREPENCCDKRTVVIPLCQMAAEVWTGPPQVCSDHTGGVPPADTDTN